MFTRLDEAKIIATAERLAQRIADHFPGAGLAKVAAEVVAVARTSERDALLLAAPRRPIRYLVGAVIVTGIACAFVVASQMRLSRVEGEPVSMVQGTEAAMNIAVLVGIGILALTRLEARWKNTRALASLHALRSLAHVIDMHQLSKDPDQARWAPDETGARPALPPAKLIRYLDYCTELLSLLGKLAALYAQSHNDAVVVQAVNDIEVLATNLSRKIWQKIAIVSRLPQAP